MLSEKYLSAKLDFNTFHRLKQTLLIKETLPFMGTSSILLQQNKSLYLKDQLTISWSCQGRSKWQISTTP